MTGDVRDRPDPVTQAALWLHQNYARCTVCGQGPTCWHKMPTRKSTWTMRFAHELVIAYAIAAKDYRQFVKFTALPETLAVPVWHLLVVGRQRAAA